MCFPSSALRDNRIQLHRSTSTELSITIADIQLSDEGEYTCSIFTMPVRTARASVTVLGKSHLHSHTWRSSGWGSILQLQGIDCVFYNWIFWDVCIFSQGHFINMSCVWIMATDANETAIYSQWTKRALATKNKQKKKSMVFGNSMCVCCWCVGREH